MPNFKHECNSCKFLGSDKLRGQAVDIYACEYSFFTVTMLVRYGNEPWQCHSFSENIMDDRFTYNNNPAFELARDYLHKAHLQSA